MMMMLERSDDDADDGERTLTLIFSLAEVSKKSRPRLSASCFPLSYDITCTDNCNHYHDTVITFITSFLQKRSLFSNLSPSLSSYFTTNCVFIIIIIIIKLTRSSSMSHLLPTSMTWEKKRFWEWKKNNIYIEKESEGRAQNPPLYLYYPDFGFEISQNWQVKCEK